MRLVFVCPPPVAAKRNSARSSSHVKVPKTASRLALCALPEITEHSSGRRAFASVDWASLGAFYRELLRGGGTPDFVPDELSRRGVPYPENQETPLRGRPA